MLLHLVTALLLVGCLCLALRNTVIIDPCVERSGNLGGEDVICVFIQPNNLNTIYYIYLPAFLLASVRASMIASSFMGLTALSEEIDIVSSGVEI